MNIKMNEYIEVCLLDQIVLILMSKHTDVLHADAWLVT